MALPSANSWFLSIVLVEFTKMNLARNLYLASKFLHPVWIVRVVQDGIGMPWTKVSDEQIFGGEIFHLDHLPA